MADNATAVSAEEALRRAREIAAKLSGGGGLGGTAALSATSGSNGAGIYGPADTGNSPSSSTDAAAAAAAAERKRKRWGVMPPEATSTRSTVVSDDLASLLSKKAKHDAAASSSAAAASENELSVHKRVWVSIDGKPRAHYVRYLASHFDEIIDKVRKQFDNPNVLELEMQGKGASKEPPVPGMPEQPLHVLVKGTAASAPIASILVEQALLDAQEAEVAEEDYEHERLLEAASTSPTNGAVSAGAIVAVDGDRSLAHYGRSFGSATASTYRPASVAQLIGAHTSNLPVILDDQNAIEEEMEVPHSVVGLIIGRGGEAIASLQMRTQCKVQIQKESELRPGQTMRLIHLKASNQEAVDAARSHIERLVQERVGATGGGGSGGMGSSNAPQGSPKDAAASKVAEAISHGHSHVQVPVPEEDVGLVIGKQGMTIRSIQDSTGANVQVPQPVPGQTHRLVDITHPTLQGAQAAQQQIQDLLNSRPRGGGGGGMSSQASGGGGGSRGMTGAHTTIQVPIPDKDVGLCIGRQGAVIRHMQNTTQTRIQIPSHPVPGETYRIASISGPAAGCQQVKLMIETIVAEQSSVSVLSGGPLGGAAGAPGNAYYGGQQAMHQPGGPGDQHAYSADWAAYHAAQAAAAQQQQAATAAVAAVAAAQQQQQQQQQQATPQGAEAYHEQFFRYAYYYGEDAARQYYGAWSPPVGTPNPYGVNPNGVQPPPTQSAAVAPIAAAAETPATAVDPSDPLFAATASSTHNYAAAVSAQQPDQYQQPAQHQQPRETSRRNVSNLPAWMTKG